MMKTDPDIKAVFRKIEREVPGLKIKEYDSPQGKIGLRTNKGDVVLTYNSYRKGWLDTRADLGPKFTWFCFKPTETKPRQYWASELAPDTIKAIFEANHREIISMLRFEKTGRQKRQLMEWQPVDILIEEIDGSLYVNQRGKKYKARDWRLSGHLFEIIDLAVSYGLGCVWRKPCKKSPQGHPKESYFEGGVDFDKGSHHIGFSRASDERWVFVIGKEARPAGIHKITFEKHYSQFLKAAEVDFEQEKGGGKNSFINPKDLKRVLDYFTKNGVIDEVEAMLNN